LTRPAHTDADELPVDVALGKVDYLEIVAFADHQATAGVWYRLLNLGFRIPAAGGTDAMANYATLRGPVGLNRVYASVANGPLSSESWLDALRQGRTFATNGPLLGFSVAGSPIGSTLRLARGQRVPFSPRMRATSRRGSITYCKPPPAIPTGTRRPRRPVCCRSSRTPGPCMSGSNSASSSARGERIRPGRLVRHSSPAWRCAGADTLRAG